MAIDHVMETLTSMQMTLTGISCYCSMNISMETMERGVVPGRNKMGEESMLMDTVHVPPSFSHQTGWTALVSRCIYKLMEVRVCTCILGIYTRGTILG